MSDIRTITATHLHPDHLGMAGRMRDASGAILQLHRAEAEALTTRAEHLPTPQGIERQVDAWRVPVERRSELVALAATAERAERGERAKLTVDRLLDDGDRLDVPGFDLVAMHTPGHTGGHLCLRDDEREILLTGDHVLPQLFAGLGLGGPTSTNALADYASSIERVGVFGGYEALPGHGYRFRGLGRRADESLEHHFARTAEVRALVGRDPGLTVWQIAERLTWTAGFAGLGGFTLYSALSQTEMHRAYVAERG